MKKHHLNNSTNNQRLEILNWLKKNKSLSTFEARTKLGIVHPAGRVLELKRQGYRIITYFSIEFDALNKPHRIARYFLGRSNHV